MERRLLKPLFFYNLLLVFTICGLVFSFQVAQANSCCGQSPASFSVLYLQQRLNLDASYSSIRAVGRQYSADYKPWRDKNRVLQNHKLSLATSLAARHQAFVSASFTKARFSDQWADDSATNFSDTLLGYTYELLPEYSFSYWKPVVYLTWLVNLPTGHSIYDQAALSEGSDVTGHNQWGSGIGLTFRKVYFPVSLVLQAKAVRLFSKEFEYFRVDDFYDSSASFLMSYASQWWGLNFNAGLNTSYLSSRKLSTSQTPSEPVQITSLILGLQKNLSETFNVGFSYSDQKAFKPVKNSVLNRSYTLNLAYTAF